ncbi:hypothetical protein [Okeania sp. SIO2B3]|nr:hypothetical protein [Okeania sp. SIO2B3]NET41069.1 hypothetical protein [Okeania sp. SIO2B3]
MQSNTCRKNSRFSGTPFILLAVLENLVGRNEVVIHIWHQVITFGLNFRQ